MDMLLPHALAVANIDIIECIAFVYVIFTHRKVINKSLFDVCLIASEQYVHYNIS